MEIRKIIYFLSLAGAILISGCQETDPETGYPIIEKGKLFIIEPELSDCNCFSKEKCLVINGRARCEGIRGFNHVEGFWTKMIVDVYERPPDVQDVGRLGYILKKRLKEINSKESFPLSDLCELYEGVWDHRKQLPCIIQQASLQKKYCEHANLKKAGLCK